MAKILMKTEYQWNVVAQLASEAGNRSNGS